MKTKLATPLRAALYARYSSDAQKDRSIEDQITELEKAAKRFGFILDKRHYYCDRAQTATTLFDRPGLTRELLGASARHEFDIVLVEATDRLARTQADTFWLADRFSFDSVKIYTPNGEVSDLQLTFEGHSNADMIKKLRVRVKRGHDAIAREGLICGRVSYGYKSVPGQPGVVAVDTEQAAVIVRIFREYVSGKSPRQIAADLMRDGVPSPSGGKHWNFQAIVGGEGMKRGLIHNQLYVGVYVKNRFYNVKNPSTGKTIARKADPDDLITTQVPHLRIIDQALWDAAHRLRKERGHKKFANGKAERAVIPRKQHLLSGLLQCAECHNRMIVVQSSVRGQRVACSAAHNRQACKHSKTYNLPKLVKGAIDQIEMLATDPEFIAERAKAKQLELERFRRAANGARDETQKQYDRLDVQIKKLVRLVEEADDVPAEMWASLQAKERERTGLKERLKYLGAENNVIQHPRAAAALGDKLKQLAVMLRAAPNDQGTHMAFGTFIEGVIVYPTVNGEDYDVEMFARDAAVGADFFPISRSVQEIVIEEGVRRFDTVRRDVSHRPQSNNLICLGRWRVAA